MYQEGIPGSRRSIVSYVLTFVRLKRWRAPVIALRGICHLLSSKRIRKQEAEVK